MDDGRARLEVADVGWITTVTAAGQPQASPVWFVWDGSVIHVATRPDVPKVRNVQANPFVAFHLDDAGPGDLVVSIEGRAEVTGSVDIADAYTTKYAGGMARLGLAPGEYFDVFSSALRITPQRWRVFVSE